MHHLSYIKVKYWQIIDTLPCIYFKFYTKVWVIVDAYVKHYGLNTTCRKGPRGYDWWLNCFYQPVYVYRISGNLFSFFFCGLYFVLKRNKSIQKKRPADGTVTNIWMQKYYLCLLRNDQPFKKKVNLTSVLYIQSVFFLFLFFDLVLWMMLLNTLNS